MNVRKQCYGTSNIVGKTIERLRKERGIAQKDFIAQLQSKGLDINPTSYSKLEGQVRQANDRELLAIANLLKVQINDLYNKDQ